MKVSLSIFVLCALFVLQTSAKVKEHGDVKNYKLIDRVAVYAVADPDNYVSKAFTFPPVCCKETFNLIKLL